MSPKPSFIRHHNVFTVRVSHIHCAIKSNVAHPIPGEKAAQNIFLILQTQINVDIFPR